jgi:hypothetical protein
MNDMHKINAKLGGHYPFHMVMSEIKDRISNKIAIGAYDKNCIKKRSLI